MGSTSDGRASAAFVNGRRALHDMEGLLEEGATASCWSQAMTGDEAEAAYCAAWGGRA